MARFRKDLHPINSVKNILDTTQLGIAAATVTNVTVSTAVNDYTGGVTDVPIGCKIKSIYLFVQIQQDAVNSNVDWYIWQNPGGALATIPVPGAVGGVATRKYVLHEEKGIPGPVNNGSPPLTFRGVIRIPRGRQRQGEGDTIQMKLRGAAVYNFCVKAIYKFYQ